MRNYIKNKIDNDIAFKIKHRLRTRIYSVVAKKWGSTEDLVGCSNKELLNYLESKFQEGMNWGNYGKWHIDHIRPCASFNLLLEKEQRKCFHYTNLQPLWAIDNIKKGARWNGKLMVEDNNE